MFLPQNSPQKSIDIRQHAENTNVTTPPSSASSSGPHHEHVAGLQCTAEASSSIGGCDLSSVNTTLSLFCCAVQLCAVCRASRARREKMRIWILGNIVKWSRSPILDMISEFEPRRVHVFFAFFFNICFQHFFCIMYVRNPDATDNRQHTGSAGCVLQPAGYNAIHACRPPAEQEVTPHACGSLSALYFTVAYQLLFLSDPAICRPAGLCFCVTHACCHRY